MFVVQMYAAGAGAENFQKLDVKQQTSGSLEQRRRGAPCGRTDLAGHGHKLQASRAAAASPSTHPVLDRGLAATRSKPHQKQTRPLMGKGPAARGSKYFCPHGRPPSRCKDCGGGAFCEHGRRRSHCKQCGGSSFCEHLRQRSRCKECGTTPLALRARCLRAALRHDRGTTRPRVSQYVP